jgi:predicted urease superfamily metal-dependent hydrolase
MGVQDELNDLKEMLAQFRLDLIKALAEIDVEIDALIQAVEKGEGCVTVQELKEIRQESRKRLEKFLSHHAEHLPRIG